jgi:thiopurine S-methyltransferase
MDKYDWKKKWAHNQISFHRAEVHPALLRFGDRLPRGKIFVPLCGKSKDLLWLKKGGFEVIGSELSPIAARSFFEEAGLSFELVTEEHFSVFRGENITLWCGDFFQLPERVFSDVRAIYDRASLIALPVEMRLAYAQHLLHRLNTVEVSYLLVTLEYSFTPTGPPYSVMEPEVRSLFGDQFRVENLAKWPDFSLGEHPRFRGREIPDEKVYFLFK